MDTLPTLWFILIALLWTGYLLLEGFDLGVGMMMITGRSSRSTDRESERRVLLNTIGPVWDANEVWLITAAAATFAAFPLWYAALLSALYLPLILVLIALIFRAVAIEYRGKYHSRHWVNGWTWAIGIGSYVSAFGIGMMLAVTTTGIPIDANGDRMGGAFAAVSLPGILGGTAVVAFSYLHAHLFVALKADGPLRHRARRLVGTWGVLLGIPMIGWVLLVQSRDGDILSWVCAAASVLCLLLMVAFARAGREGSAFIAVCGFLLASFAALFGAVFPVLLPSTIDRGFDLTILNASSHTYTLTVMSIVASVGLPFVIASQAWSYWVFRHRVAPSQIPAIHPILPAILQRHSTQVDGHIATTRR